MWIYPVDMKRANEFGQVFEKEKIESEESVKLDKNEEVETDQTEKIKSETRKRTVKSKN